MQSDGAKAGNLTGTRGSAPLINEQSRTPSNHSTGRTLTAPRLLHDDVRKMSVIYSLPEKLKKPFF